MYMIHKLYRMMLGTREDGARIVDRLRNGLFRRRRRRKLLKREKSAGREHIERGI